MRITHFYDDVIIVIFTKFVGLYPIRNQLSKSSLNPSLLISPNFHLLFTRSCENFITKNVLYPYDRVMRSPNDRQSLQDVDRQK